MQAGVAVTDPHNGQIIAMLGGRHTGNVVCMDLTELCKVIVVLGQPQSH